MELTSFKAYDVRGKVPAALNEDLARQIGVAYVHETGARNVVIGHDARLSGPALYAALAPFEPMAVERFPLTLEEIFLYEMEVEGYDANVIFG